MGTNFESECMHAWHKLISIQSDVEESFFTSLSYCRSLSANVNTTMFTNENYKLS